MKSAPDRRVALVAGASSGSGQATALALAAEGFHVTAVARRSGPLHDLQRQSTLIHPFPIDVTDRQSVERLATVLDEQYGALDVLVVAVGHNIPRRRTGELSYDDWLETLQVNATGAFNVVHVCLPLLRAAQGLAIVIASVSSRWPDASGVAYQAAKRAVLGMAHAIALEERDHGVRVTALLPGMINSPLLDARPLPPPPETRALAIQPEDIAEICVFLATLHPRVFVPEMVVLPTALDRIGHL